jgi:hypothetical protein
MRKQRLYRIICRKRSDNPIWNGDNVVYWMPNRAGYTTFQDEAGLYTSSELDDCAGNGWDWFAERVK